MNDSTPRLAAWHQRYGAVDLPVAGGPPAHYGDPEGEGVAACTAAALVDLSDRDLWEVTGRDRIRLLHAMLSNDVKNRPPGEGCLATFCNEQGRMVSDLRLLVLEDRVWIDLEPGVGAVLVPEIERFIVADKAYLAPLGATVAALGLVGPGAAAALAGVGVAGAGPVPR